MTMKKIEPGDPMTQSADVKAENIDRLKELFPELVTEGPQGTAINVDVLKSLVGDATVTDAEEKYGLNWHGKRLARQIALTPSTGTLRPCPEESVDWDTTRNLMIEGDNLEVLKLLQKSYAGKVKMIYIDPPYNTGKDFVYPDDFRDNIRNYLELTGQTDGEGRRVTSNTEASGRFHTDWMNMMYPRLRLARNLLRDDGVLFVSIDDNEQSKVKEMLDEIYGESNFLAKIIIQSNKRGQTYKEIAKCHEYLFVYYKTEKSSIGELEKKVTALPCKDEYGGYELWELRNRNPKFGRHNRPNLFYPIFIDPSSANADGLALIALERSEKFCVEVLPRNSNNDDSCWRWGKKKLQTEGIDANPTAVFGKLRRDGGWNIYEKSRKSTTKAKSIWLDNGVISEQGTVEAGRIDMAGLLDFPKPLELIKRCILLATGCNDIILDFFAGSGTTACASMMQCSEDNQQRRHILVQLPEPTFSIDSGKKVAKKENGNAFENSYLTIADITKERLRRAGKKIKEENPLFAGDTGFRVFKLDTSNIRPWQPDRDDLEKTLFNHQEHLVEGRSEQDILFELLLKLGLDLTVPMEQRAFAGKTVHSIGLGALMVCLAEEIKRTEVEPLAQGIMAWWRELAPAVPVQFVFRDSGFVDDVAKTNLAAILEQNIPSDQLAGIRSL